MKILIGADPEVFAKKAGRVVSAEGLVRGTKAEPHKVKGGAIQVDGMALEFNIDPASTAEEFNDNIVRVMRALRNQSGCSLAIKPVHTFTKAQMAKASEQAKELGCEPDMNAYTKKQNTPPEVGDDVLFRTAAGHIHIGWWDKDVDPSDPGHIEACATLTKALDATLGLLSVIMEGDNKRRELYGKAGAFRAKPYGMEYRVPSNWWIANTKYRTGVFELVKMVVEGLFAGIQPQTKKNFKAKQIINGKYVFTALPEKEAVPLLCRYHIWEYTHKAQLDEITPFLNKHFGKKGW